MTATTARHLASTVSVEQVRRHVEAFDWLVSRRDAKALKNPAGFLASSIRDDYAAPPEFVSEHARNERMVKKQAKPKERDELNRAMLAEEDRKLRAEAESFDQRWEALPTPEQIRLEQEALTSANRIETEVLERGGPFAEATRRTLLRRVLREGSQRRGPSNPP